MPPLVYKKVKGPKDDCLRQCLARVLNRPVESIPTSSANIVVVGPISSSGGVIGKDTTQSSPTPPHVADSTTILE